MSKLTDTSPEAERVLIESYRRMSMLDKWRQMGAIYHAAKSLHAAGVRLRNPAATVEEIRDDWRRQTLGKELARKVQEATHGRGSK